MREDGISDTLTGDRHFEQAGFGPLSPGLHINTLRRRYVNKDFVISQWSLPMIQKLISQEGRRLGFIMPVMGAVAIAQLNNVYSAKVLVCA